MLYLVLFYASSPTEGSSNAPAGTTASAAAMAASTHPLQDDRRTAAHGQRSPAVLRLRSPKLRARLGAPRPRLGGGRASGVLASSASGSLAGMILDRNCWGPMSRTGRVVKHEDTERDRQTQPKTPATYTWSLTFLFFVFVSLCLFTKGPFAFAPPPCFEPIPVGQAGN